MTTEDWITYPEAAKILGDSEESIKRMAERGVLKACRIEDQFFVDKDHLLKWMKRREEPQVQITKIYEGIRHTMLVPFQSDFDKRILGKKAESIYHNQIEKVLEHYGVIYARSQAQHPGERGVLYEQLLRDFLRDYLPRRFYVGTGQVLSSGPASDADGLLQQLSRQLDVIIFNSLHHPILLPKYELFPIEGTLAVIEVKSKLEKRTLVGTPKEPGALPLIESAKRLFSEEASVIWSEPKLVKVEGQLSDLREMPSPLGIVFAFESISPKNLVKYWADWNASKKLRYRTDMICLLKKQVLIVDTNRFNRLFDSHQITTFEPIGSVGKGKLVAIRTPAVLFFFINLLLRDLRKMSAYSEHLVTTTPSSYLREVEISRLFWEENARNPSAID